MPKPLDPRFIDILKKYHPDPRSAIWDCHGSWVILHKAIEVIAANAGITFDPPQVIVADPADKMVAICVTGRFGSTACEWSIGEAAPYNNKNTYPFAMAEKRAKDRVVLKLLGLHGEIYSEDEADDFKASKNKPADKPAEAPAKANDDLPTDADMIATALEEIKEADSIEKLVWLGEQFAESLSSLPAKDVTAIRAVYTKRKAQLEAA